MEHLLLSQLEHLVPSLATALLHFCWQAAAVAITLKVLLLVTDKKLLKLRYYCAVLALASCVILPVLTFTDAYRDNLHQAAAHQLSSNNYSTGPETVAATQSNLVDTITLQSQAEVAEAARGWINQWLPQLDGRWLVAFWSIGVFVMLFRLTKDLFKTYRLTRVGTSAVDPEIMAMVQRISGHLRLKQTVNVFRSQLVNVPVVIGWLKPTVLLPIAVTIGLERKQLELILAHELAHVKRMDFLVNLLQGVVQVIFFYHPCIYWINQVIREEREYICDAMAVATLDNDSDARLQLAKALLNVEELKEGNLALVAVAASDGHLKSRVKRIVNGERKLLPSSQGILAAMLATALSFTTFAVTSDLHQAAQLTKVVQGEVTSAIPELANRASVRRRDELLEPSANDATFGDSGKQSDIDSGKQSDIKAEQKSQSAPSLKSMVHLDKVTHKIDSTSSLQPDSQQPDSQQSTSESLKDKPLAAEKAKLNNNPSKSSQSADELVEKVLNPSSDKLASRVSSALENTKNEQLATQPSQISFKAKDVPELPKAAAKADKKALKQALDEEIIAKRETEQKALELQRAKQKVALLDARRAPQFVEPKALVTPYPQYPANAFSSHMSARIRVNFVIDTNGRAVDLKFSSGTPFIFKREITEKLDQWRYQPALRNGDKIAYSTSILFSFELPDEALNRTFVGSRIRRFR